MPARRSAQPPSHPLATVIVSVSTSAPPSYDRTSSTPWSTWSSHSSRSSAIRPLSPRTKRAGSATAVEPLSSAFTAASRATGSTMPEASRPRTVGRTTMALPRTTDWSPSMRSKGPATCPGISPATTAVDSRLRGTRLSPERTNRLARSGLGRSSGLVTTCTSQCIGRSTAGISDRPVTPVTRLTDRNSVPVAPTFPARASGSDSRSQITYGVPRGELHLVDRVGAIQHLRQHQTHPLPTVTRNHLEQVARGRGR